MGGLSTALSIATGALGAQEAAITTVNNNIANAETPGYSREVVDLSSQSATESNGTSVGNGVELTGTTSVRDQLLNLRIQQQTSEQASASAENNVLSLVQPLFAGSSTVGSNLSSFFTSLSALSTAPSNAADRQTVIGNAQSLVNSFNSTSAALTSAQSSLNEQVAGDVTKINGLTSQIAALNPQISTLQATGQDGGTLLDQRIQLEQQLSTLTGMSITSTNDGDTITIGSGTPLVVADQSYPLRTSVNSIGLTDVLSSNGVDVTSSVSGGDLGGALTARDTTIPGFLAQLNTLASGFASAINTAQASGYDLDGNAGGALFTVAASGGAAATIALRTTNGSALAISADGAANSTGNLSTLTQVQSAALPSGTNPTDTYASLVDGVGIAASSASTQSTALQASLTQLTNQQQSVSGVSIDEESSNLIRYQQAYEAAAEVVTTLQSLFSTTINMMTASGG